jgi:hypothetical protein
MKVILEEQDLMRILEEHFGSEFKAGDIVIRADPFEVEVRNVPVPASEKGEARPAAPRTEVPPTALPSASDDDTELVARRADADATTDPPPPGNDETSLMDASGTPASIIQQSKALEQQLERERGAPRRKGGSATPPTNFQNEV